MRIPDEDLKMELLRDPKYNYGGQAVGSPNEPIMVTHKPTGISATCGAMRSQYKNRSVAIEMLEYGLMAAGYNYDGATK